MRKYILSYRFEVETDEVATKFAEGASSALTILQGQSKDKIENLQVAIVRVEEDVADE